jgi:tetratricopeptide (TPR) repeat protein
LIGYRVYRSKDAAADSYARALALFNMAFGKLESAPAARSSNQLRALRATLNLYRGNIYFLRGDRVGAEREFQAAIDASTQDLDHAVWFIEPLNNLGFVYVDAGRVPEALTVLGKADRECSAEARADRRANPICVYAWYNLGNALVRARKYGEAEDHATRVIRFFETNDPQAKSSVDRRLLGLAHQTRAFSLVMRAAQQGTSDARLRLADEAEVEWKSGLDVLTRLKSAAPPKAALTLARIHAVRGDWNAALAVLRPLEKEAVMDPDVSLLLSAATWCTGQHQASVDYLRGFEQASSSGEFRAALLFFDNLTAKCP